ncbi:MAG: DUF2812 domain-containing protein [Chloroflexi bacterium]|nr:DUF2812 domain-containing protein [Chloroflexota bacterium]
MKQFHWFWAWDDEKEEAWLHEMSQKGWHFTSVSFPGNYTFKQGNPIDYVYRLDYFTDRKNMSSYLQIFEDSAWDYIGEMNGWQYFRQETIKGEVSEIYTDGESKSKKYQRIMMVLVIIFPALLNAVILVNRGADNDIIQIFAFLLGIMLLLYVYSMARLLHRITQLRKKV